MKSRYILLTKSCAVVLFISPMYGCVSQISPVEETSREMIGRPVAEIEETMARPGSYASRIGWKETTYQLVNRNLVYIEPVRPDCFIHWEVSQQGIVIGYRTVGNRCY